VLGMWFRQAHAWPHSMTKEKEMFLLGIDPCLTRLLSFPGTVSNPPPPPPPACV
jgi:hypothetical protein